MPPSPESVAGPSVDAWRRLLGEPLVHFFVVGALVFGAYWLFKPPPTVVDDKRIEISANDIRQIALGWVSQGRLPPTQEQLRNLIDQKIAEEVLFREGLALGLDRNDEIVKRRVAQKMDFLAADIAAMDEPGKAGLEQWFVKHSDRFALPPRVSFRHLYYSPDKRGDAARSDAVAALNALGSKAAGAPGAEAAADPFMLRSTYSSSTPDQMVKEFGPAFTTELFKLEPGGWRGPVKSGFGWHLVWVDALEPGRTPNFEEIQADVRSAWTDDRYAEIKRQALAEMSALYTVVVAPFDGIDLNDLGPARPVDPTLKPVAQ